ncbi:aldo/keto reductase [Propionicimonas sp.]|uniref:aldo/keto reductase n=1 Tax=Propionicimonas sp. TaxID=1955623 RepID=UPI0039E66994
MHRISTLRVSPLCLGGNVFGWTADAASSEAILDAFTDAGGNFIDTADAYSTWVPGHRGGESESVIGGWLRHRGNRDRVVVATKVAKHPVHRGLRPANIRICLDGSRRRLGVETIDLYYAHEDDPHVPTAEWLGAFDQLIRTGAVRHYGLSNFTTERVAEVIDVATKEGLALPVAVQPQYNLVHRAEVETSGLAALCAQHHLAIIPYYGLAAGFLTGKYARGEQVHGPRAGRVRSYATDAGFDVLDAVVAVADELGVEPATVALAWVGHQPGVTAPIASASSAEQVAPLVAFSGLKLTRSQLNRLSRASLPFT